MRKQRHVVVLLTICILCSCRDADHIIYVQESTMGVDASVSMQGTQRLHFGFGRDAFAIVPKKNKHGDTMSALSYSYYSYQFPSTFEFNNFISTGSAAKLISKDCKASTNTCKTITNEVESLQKQMK